MCPINIQAHTQLVPLYQKISFEEWKKRASFCSSGLHGSFAVSFNCIAELKLPSKYRWNTGVHSFNFFQYVCYWKTCMQHLCTKPAGTERSFMGSHYCLCLINPTTNGISEKECFGNNFSLLCYNDVGWVSAVETRNQLPSSFPSSKCQMAFSNMFKYSSVILTPLHCFSPMYRILSSDLPTKS